LKLEREMHIKAICFDALTRRRKHYRGFSTEVKGKYLTERYGGNHPYMDGVEPMGSRSRISNDRKS
jgi:hypothetical protein